MSARGRGRGRGRSPSGARLLLQRSAQEAGFTGSIKNNIQDITKPQLFPDFEWHSSGRQLNNQQETIPPTRSEQQKASSTVYLIRKSRDIQHRFQNSPYYVRPTQEVDVNRYGKRQRPLDPDVLLLEKIGKTADPRILPSELLKKDRSFSFDGTDGLSKQRISVEETLTKEDGEDGDDAADLSDHNVHEDDEEVDDYIQDYYASEEESDGGGGEATF